MSFLLDTNSCIYLFTGVYPTLTARVADMAEGSLAISAITYGELAVGTFRGKAPTPAVLARFIAQIPVLPFDTKAADAFTELPFRRGSFDRLIAGHALALGFGLVSHNTADFTDIPALRVEDWTV